MKNEKRRWKRPLFLAVLTLFFSSLIFLAYPEGINWNIKGLELYKNGKYKEAIECFDKVLNNDPGAFKVWNNKGNALYKLGHYEKALLCYDKAIEISSEYENSWYGKGCVLIKLKKPEEALQCFNKALELNPKDRDAKNKKEEILAELNIMDMEKSMEYFNKGNFLYIQEHYEEAIECYDKALSYDKNFIDALYCRGCALKCLKKHTESLICFDRVLEISPDHKHGRIKRDELSSNIENHTTDDMVFIKGGEITVINNENTGQTFTVKNFYMKKYEVTNREFSKFSPHRIYRDDDLPAVNITWYEGADYCNWLSEKEGLTPCYSNKTTGGEYRNISMNEKGYRLPSELEWEYACRAGSTSDYYWGNNMNGDFCWYYENSGLTPHRGGQKKPNKFGLYDMTGNVWEWCTAIGPSMDICRIRGGGFLEEPYKCKSSYRGSMYITKSIDTGFRIVRNE